MSTITFLHAISGVNTDVTSAKLSDSTGTYGVRRTDTGAVVVNDGTDMTRVSAGLYQYEFTDPANDLTYEYAVEFVYNNVTKYQASTMLGPTSSLGGTTLSDLISRVRVNTNRTSTTVTTNGRIARYLNDGLRELARRHPWKDLDRITEVTLVADTHRYSLATNTRNVYGMRIMDDDDSRVLFERSIQWVNMLEPDLDSRSSAKPTYYAIDGNSYELVPPPDEAYTLYRNEQIWPSLMNALTDTPDIDLVDDALVAYGTAALFRSLQQFTEADRWEEMFERRYRTAMRDDSKRPGLHPQMDGVVGHRRSGLPTNYIDNGLVGLY